LGGERGSKCHFKTHTEKKNTSVSGAKATLTASDVASQTVLALNFQVEFQQSESEVRISLQ